MCKYLEREIMMRLLSSLAAMVYQRSPKYRCITNLMTVLFLGRSGRALLITLLLTMIISGVVHNIWANTVSGGRKSLKNGISERTSELFLFYDMNCLFFALHLSPVRNRPSLCLHNRDSHPTDQDEIRAFDDSFSAPIRGSREH